MHRLLSPPDSPEPTLLLPHLPSLATLTFLLLKGEEARLAQGLGTCCFLCSAVSSRDSPSLAPRGPLAPPPDLCQTSLQGGLLDSLWGKTSGQQSVVWALPCGSAGSGSSVTAVAWVRSLAQEFPRAAGQKKKKEKEKKRDPSKAFPCPPDQEDTARRRLAMIQEAGPHQPRNLLVS